MSERIPLRAAASGDPVVVALDELDERMERRHSELSRGLLRVIAGLAGAIAVVTLTALLILGDTRGVDPREVAKAVSEIMASRDPADGN